MEIAFFWILLSAAVGVFAAKRGRNAVGWFVISAFLSPLIGLIFCLLVKDLSSQEVSPDTHVKCPDCRELVLKDARKCKHCGCALVPQ